MKRTVLLLTACLNPGGMKYTVLQDAEERKRQYKRAIDYYLEKTKYRIVFCDNSGADLTELKNPKYVNRIEFLSFSGNDYNANYGKGYGEFLIIQYAFENSRFIKKASIVIKITGRLFVENLMEITKWHQLLFGNRKNCFFGSGDRNYKQINSRCFIASKNFFEDYFLRENNTINDSKGYYFEHYLFDRVMALPKDFIISDFVFPISISGQSGTSGECYKGINISRYEELRLIRDYCERKKLEFFKIKTSVYYRISVVSFIVRVEKAACRMLFRQQEL